MPHTLGDVLIFRMEIIKIKGDKVDAMKCDAVTGEGCNDKQTKFLEKAKAKFDTKEKLEGELARLEKNKGFI